MATSTLLPGFGGLIDMTVAVTLGVTAAKSDDFDASKCAQLMVQVTGWVAGALSLQAEQSLDGTHWASIGDPATVALGDVVRLCLTVGPFGRVRYSLLSSDTTASATLRTVGYPAQWSF